VGGQRHAPAALPWEREPVTIVQEAGWAPGSVRTGAENLAPPVFDPRNVQFIWSRLSYPGPQFASCNSKIFYQQTLQPLNLNKHQNFS